MTRQSPIQAKHFGHWKLEFEIYPSTGLRVVSLSNHLFFGACYLEFFELVMKSVICDQAQ
jgi:hypothetical protein